MKTCATTTSATTSAGTQQSRLEILFASGFIQRISVWMALPSLPFFRLSVSAYSIHYKHLSSPSRSRRYFVGEALLPPLGRVDGTSSFQSCDHQISRCDNGTDLEAIYTNDPAEVHRWLANNVPSQGCTLGFDLEVCLCVFVK